MSPDRRAEKNLSGILEECFLDARYQDVAIESFVPQRQAGVLLDLIEQFVGVETRIGRALLEEIQQWFEVGGLTGERRHNPGGLIRLRR